MRAISSRRFAPASARPEARPAGRAATLWKAPIGEQGSFAPRAERPASCNTPHGDVADRDDGTENRELRPGTEDQPETGAHDQDHEGKGGSRQPHLPVGLWLPPASDRNRLP